MTSDQHFYDLQYDAWRRGRNPDFVSRDRYDYALSVLGYYADEITLDMVYPKPQPLDSSEANHD